MSSQPTISVPAGDSTTFTVSFSPSSGGCRTASIRIANDDADENPYTFEIFGQGNDFSSLPTLDEPGNVGDLSSIVVNSNNQLSVSYADSSNHELKLWVDDGFGGGTAGDKVRNGCEIRTIIASDFSGRFSSIMRTASDELAVSFTGQFSRDLTIWIDDGYGGGISGDNLVNGYEVRAPLDLGDPFVRLNDSIAIDSNGHLAVALGKGFGDKVLLWLDNGAGAGVAGDRIVNGAGS